jgi:hypothetical protein
MKRTLSLLALLGSICMAKADAIPRAPEHLVAQPPTGPVTIQALLATLTWQDMSQNEKGFVIESCYQDPATGEFTPWEAVAALPRNTTTWTDLSPPWGVWAAYRVSAVGNKGAATSNVAFCLLH